MSESNPSKAGGLWARLFSVLEEPEPEPAKEEPAPTVEPVAESPSSDGVPELVVEPAAPVAEPELPVVETLVAEAPPVVPLEPPPVPETAPAPQVCRACGAARKNNMAFCDDCGWLFPTAGAAPPTASPVRDSDMAAPSTRLQNRYDRGKLLCERGNTQRHSGTDSTNGHPVVIVSCPVAEQAVPVAEAIPVAVLADDDIMPGFDDDLLIAMAIHRPLPLRPGPASPGRRRLLEAAKSPVLPKGVSSLISSPRTMSNT